MAEIIPREQRERSARNKKDKHLENCLRQIRTALIDNKPVSALFALEMLERHLYGKPE